MSTQHTPGRLRVKGTRIYADGIVLDCVATMQVSNQVNWDEDARRLVACWNLLQPFTTEQIEAFQADVLALAAQRDELLKALRVLLPRAESLTDEGPAGEGWQSDELKAEIAQGYAVIAKTEGKQ